MLSRFHRIAERDGQTDGQDCYISVARRSRVSMLTHDRNGEAGFVERWNPRCRKLLQEIERLAGFSDFHIPYKQLFWIYIFVFNV